MWGCRPWDGPVYSGVLVETGPGGAGLTKTGFLAMWAFMAAVEPKVALEHLLLLGYDGEPSAAFAVSRPRRLEHRKGDGPGRSAYQACPLAFLRSCARSTRPWHSCMLAFAGKMALHVHPAFQ